MQMHSDEPLSFYQSRRISGVFISLPAFQKRKLPANIPARLPDRQRGKRMLPLPGFPPAGWRLRAVRRRLLLQRRELNAADSSGKLQQPPPSSS